LTLLVFNNLHSITSSSVSWIFPKVSRESNKDIVFEYYCELQGLLLFSSISISFLLIVFDGIFKLWLDSNTYHSVIDHIHLILLFLPIYSLGILPFHIVKAKGYIKHNFYSDAITLIIRIIAIYILYHYYGLSGIIMAIGLSGFFISIYLSVVMKIKIFSEYKLSLSKIFLIPLFYVGSMLTTHIFLKLVLVVIMCCFFYSVFSVHLSNILKKRSL